MCKTRFDSQGLILNGFYKKNIFEKKTLMEREEWECKKNRQWKQTS